MRTFTVDYNRDPDRERHGRIHRGYWLHDTPRLMLACRIAGHRPVVDGTGPHAPGLHAARWVVCDRCGVRPNPQGSLDPAQWHVGQPYTGPLERPTGVQWEHIPPADPQPPGPWTRRPTGSVGAEVVVGGVPPGASVELKVGNSGSDHVLAAHLRVWPFGSIYVHTERHGTWLQRRFNPTGYQSRVTGVDLGDGRLRWRLWAKRDESSRDTPRWQYGSIRIDPRDLLLGERRYSYEDTGDPVDATVRMPHGDDHQVRLQLQRRTLGRRRGRKKLAWSVDWRCDGGIATRSGEHRHVYSSAVDVPDVAVREGTWAAEAASAIAADMTAMRTRCGMRAPA